jgi:protoheme IX farnesyltransferase
VSESPVQFDYAGASAAYCDGGSVSDYIALLKPRVMSLVVFTGFVGLYMAPGSIHPFLGFISVLCIAVAAGASGAINMWYDRDIDSIMTRTQGRPIPAGRLKPGAALAFGNTLAVGAVAVMALCINWQAAFLLAFTIIFYIFVYTIWLKRRTPQNIVIGGAAGAFPPMVGWTAVTGDISLQSLILFAIIFMWTPPHFWALSLYRCGDYERAGVPMLPVVSGGKETRRQIVIYALILAPLGVAPTFVGMASWAYGFVAFVMGVFFAYLAVRIVRFKTDDAAESTFKFSLIYLFVVFAALIVDKAVIASALNGG